MTPPAPHRFPLDIAAPSKQAIVYPYLCVIVQTLKEAGLWDWGSQL